MKKVTVSVFCMLGLLLFTLPAISQSMTWTTNSDVAMSLASSGEKHLLNAEFAQAYTDFFYATKVDPDFTDALVLLANLSYGEASKDYAEKAIASATNKPAGEQLFASLVDPKNNTQDSRLSILDKLHTMFPDDIMIGSRYVMTRATPEERFAAAQEFIKKFPNEPSMYNTLAYFYMQDKKDNDKAKQYFDKYLAMDPDGCNPYDSMGEYYLNTGDTENAEKYYKLALEKYPFNNSSINALQKIQDDKKK